MGVGDGTGRPPSPITFAPEERERPISPIVFASPVSPPAVDGVQPESDKVEGGVWQDLAFPSNEMGDDDAELAVGGSRFRHWEEEDECSNVHPQTAFQTRFIVFVHPFLAYLRRLYS